jgi:hypothetical protein
MLAPEQMSADGACSLQLQDHSETFIDGALQTGRQRAGVLSQETAVEGKDLRDIDYRVSWETHCPGGQQDISRGVSEFNIAGDRGDDRGLDSTEIEGVCLNH